MNKQEIKAAGLCIWCKQPRGEYGTASHCRPCAKRNNADLLARKKRKLAEGLCSACNKPRGLNGTNTHCPACAEKARNRTNKNADKRLNSRICAECNIPIDSKGTKRLCSKCVPVVNNRLSNKRHEWRAKREANGQCTECGGARDDLRFKLCRNCRTSDYGSPRTEPTGRCRDCGSELKNDSTNRRCPDCITHQLIRNAGLSSNFAPIMIKKLERQNFKCYYTGVRLYAGVNLSIDHIIPKASHNFPGIQCLDNVVWCDVIINKRKSTKTIEEFRHYCKLCGVTLVV